MCLVAMVCLSVSRIIYKVKMDFHETFTRGVSRAIKFGNNSD